MYIYIYVYFYVYIYNICVYIYIIHVYIYVYIYNMCIYIYTSIYTCVCIDQGKMISFESINFPSKIHLTHGQTMDFEAV